MEKVKKVKISSVRWELTPVYNEHYINEDELISLSQIDDEIELLETLEDILGDDFFIYTSDGTDYMDSDYDGELSKIYIKNNEHSIYLSSVISIGDNIVSKHLDDTDNSIEELLEEHNSLKVESIKSIIRDNKLNKLLND